MLFIKNETKEVAEALTSVKAQEIYALLKTGKGETEMFVENAISFKDSKLVTTEMARLESEYISKVSGSFLLEAKIPATYTEENEIETEEVPAVYYKVTTKIALLKTMSSDLLSLDEVCSDIEDYYGFYEEDRDFTDFKALVTNE